MNIARSLDSDQFFNIADESFCLKNDGPETPIKLKLPEPVDLFNLVEPDAERKTPPGLARVRWVCYGPGLDLVCCVGRLDWDLTRESCVDCKVFEELLADLILDIADAFCDDE